MRPRVSEHKGTIAVCWPVTLSVAHVSAGMPQDKCADMPESWKKVYIHWNNAVGQAVMAANAALNVTAFRQVIVHCILRMLCSILWERREFGEKYNPRAAVKILLGRCIGTVLWGSHPHFLLSDMVPHAEQAKSAPQCLWNSAPDSPQIEYSAWKAALDGEFPA